MRRGATGAWVAIVMSCSLIASGCTATGSSPLGTGTASASVGTTPSASALPTGTPVPRTAVETHLAMAYAKTSPTQTLDLYLPPSSGVTTLPLVVLIHGGAFAGGDSSSQGHYAQRLVREGFAVASLNYRLSGEAHFPAGAQDVKAAVRWLRAHAGTYGIDPSRFGAWGQSAGGWMANMLGVTGDQATVFDDDALGNPTQSSAVQAVVSWYGPTNFATMDAQAALTACGAAAQAHGPAGSPESLWLGEAVATSTKVGEADLGAYASRADRLPPWYFAHGDSDCSVAPGQSLELKQVLEAEGSVSVTSVVLPGLTHADPRFDTTQVEPTVAFLTSSLGR